MKPENFRHALYNGLGRVPLYLQDHDATPYQDIILRLCTHNILYDTPEESKFDYIFQIIQLTGEPQFYRQRILDFARNVSPEAPRWDVFHVMSMVQHFAEAGDTEATQILYDSFLKNIADEERREWFADALIEIDAWEGLVYVLEKFDDIGLDDQYALDRLLYAIEYEIDPAELQANWTQLRQQYTILAEYKPVGQRQTRRRGKRNRAPQFTTYADIRPYLGTPVGTYNIRQWAKTASESDIEQAANDLLTVTHTKLLYHLLIIFTEREFPYNPVILMDYITEFADDKTIYPNVSTLGMSALRHIAHPKVRQFAVQHITQQTEWLSSAMRILEKNWQAGDWALLAQATNELYLSDSDTRH